MEFIEENLDKLKAQLTSDCYVLFDCPGQVRQVLKSDTKFSHEQDNIWNPKKLSPSSPSNMSD